MRSRKLHKIHQLVPDIVYGDAITNYAITLRTYLRSLGYRSDILAVRCYEKRMAKAAKIFEPGFVGDKDGILYHHSIGSELTPHVVAHPGPKCLIYHNITPAEFYYEYRPNFARKLNDGRNDLKRLATAFPLSAGDSAFNVSELKRWGFDRPTVLPIPVSPRKWDEPPNQELMDRLGDGKANLLFVGRISPNKCQDHLITAFSYYLTMDLNARLIILGEGFPDDPYYTRVVNMINQYGLLEHVILAGKVNDSDLQAFYKSAHLFWSMSEHEGFGIPLIEAMWFDVPVLAYKSTAVPETLGDAGIMFNTKEDLVSVAALAKLLVRDQGLRSRLLKSQRRRRSVFLPEAVLPKFDELIAKMEELANKQIS
jgi:glycosyltransferase involved in cell wall biosynthesis